MIILTSLFLFFLFLELGSRFDNINIVTQYQIDRINEFFSTDLDFSQAQSRLLISSGGLFGQYFSAENIQKVFVPVETTDFIFAAFAYNFGFFGILFLLGLWGLLISRLRRILIVSNSDFDKFVIAGFIALLSFQIFINISTVVGIIPVTGLPFPLLSLGGSSMVSISVIFGITNRIFIENNITI
jgi:rod shape determining protein RodA